MGHIHSADREYQLLQQRLDHCIEGAPSTPVFIKILKLLFTESEANLARQIPLRPIRLEKLSKKTGIPIDELEGKINEMAKRGLVFDAAHKGQRYVVLAPVVIGFFEFTFMRTRDDLPLAELAHLFEQYLMQDDKFARSLFAGSTQPGRALVHEEAIHSADYSEILDWEKASYIIKSASRVGLSLCACRHKASHLGTACDKPQHTCLTLNNGAGILIKNGLAQEISNSRALDILQKCKELGLAQTADNVQRNVGYICNCCGCCCGMFQAVKTFNINKAIVSSNWIMRIDISACTGCGACVKACPLGAISLKAIIVKDRTKKVATCNENLCLGCGVCYSVCKFSAISLRPRPQRVFTPEDTFDKMVIMAIERGKLSNLIFDDPGRLSHRALGRIFNLIENSVPIKTMLAKEHIQSVFLNTIVKGVKKIVGN